VLINLPTLSTRLTPRAARVISATILTTTIYNDIQPPSRRAQVLINSPGFTKRLFLTLATQSWEMGEADRVGDIAKN
jgi:hypothetical protein